MSNDTGAVLVLGGLALGAYILLRPTTAPAAATPPAARRAAPPHGAPPTFDLSKVIWPKYAASNPEGNHHDFVGPRPSDPTHQGPPAATSATPLLSFHAPRWGGHEVTPATVDLAFAGATLGAPIAWAKGPVLASARAGKTGLSFAADFLLNKVVT